MDALISGRGHGALLIDGAQLQWLDPEGKTYRVEHDEVSALLHDRGDFFQASDVSRGDVAQQLRLARATNEALLICDDLLDSTTPPHFRQRAATELNERIADKDVLDHLERVLWAHELPEQRDFDGAIKCCQMVDAGRAQSLLMRLRHDQPTIATVRRSWEQVSEHAFMASNVGRRNFHYFAVRDGLFRELVRQLELANLSVVDIARLLEKKTPRVHRLSGTVLAEWATIAAPSNDEAIEDARLARTKTDVRSTGRRGEMTGVVISAKTAKTVNVRVDRFYEHSKYGKRMFAKRKFLCHCENDDAREGDIVVIAPCRPRSRRKHHEVVIVIPVAAKRSHSSGGYVA